MIITQTANHLGPQYKAFYSAVTPLTFFDVPLPDGTQTVTLSFTNSMCEVRDWVQDVEVCSGMVCLDLDLNCDQANQLDAATYLTTITYNDGVNDVVVFEFSLSIVM